MRLVAFWVIVPPELVTAPLNVVVDAPVALLKTAVLPLVKVPPKVILPVVPPVKVPLLVKSAVVTLSIVVVVIKTVPLATKSPVPTKVLVLLVNVTLKKVMGVLVFKLVIDWLPAAVKLTIPPLEVNVAGAALF
jgi:hypothetical protein